MSTTPKDTESEVFDPLTEREFNDGAVATHNGIPLVEGGDASAVFAFGHLNPAEFASAVNAYDRETADEERPYRADDVEHRWAVTRDPDPDEWWISWAGKWADHPLRFAVTVVSR